jgi:hypothetical protein
LAVTAGVAVTLAHAPYLMNKGHAQETGCRGETTSLLDISDAYLPSLTVMHRVTVYSTAPCDEFILWTHRERYHQQNALQFPLKGHCWSAEIRPATDAEAILFIDIPTDLPGAPSNLVDASGKFAALVSENGNFQLLHQWHLSQYGCTVTLWDGKNRAAANAAKAAHSD